MEDDHSVISSGLVITPETVISRSFSSAFRGYHPAEVRQFLRRVSDEMAASAGREVELRRALQEALARAAHPELDETTVTNVLGEHAARLIASARDTAASIAIEAQKKADAVLRDADMRVARMREEADGLMARRTAEADGAAAGIQHAAEVEARALTERAAAEAQAVIEGAKRQGRDMVDEARAVRERMLADLARRRRSAQLQVEQLRAARDRLMAAYDVVRRTLDEATSELRAAEPEARMAAGAVARRSPAPDLELRVEPHAEVWSPPSLPAEPERAMSLVGSSAVPAVGEQREAAVPATALFRRLEERAPSPPDRPPLRPQTVADAVAGRRPASALVPAPPPPGPPPPPPRRPSPPPSPPMSELATMDVPAVTPDPTGEEVEALFARIRADREGGSLADGPDTGLPDSSATVPPTPDAPQAVDPVAGERALEARDDLLDNVEAGLIRALKRVLQDEQNEVLDRLRRLGATAAAAVLPELVTQTADYRDAALPWLQQAARAGVSFASDPAPGTDAEKAYPSLEHQAQALAVELVEPLRERLSRAVEGGGIVDDASVLAESLRATYRQWKVQHVEACARHHAVVAFAVGSFVATPEGTTLQWLVDDDGQCPDCDDNALAGPTTKGQPFPTGQLHPPAHPGCRCLLAPVTT